MESFSKKQITQIIGYDKEKRLGLDVCTKHNNNYASCYAIPISTPKYERKGHNGPHESHMSKK